MLTGNYPLLHLYRCIHLFISNIILHAHLFISISMISYSNIQQYVRAILLLIQSTELVSLYIGYWTLNNYYYYYYYYYNNTHFFQLFILWIFLFAFSFDH